MMVGEKQIEARPMTAGDMAVIGPLAGKIAPHFTDGQPDLNGLMSVWPDILDTAEFLMSDGVVRAELRTLPLHEAIEHITHFTVEWLTVNGPYIAEKVTPAVTQMAEIATAITSQIAAQYQEATKE